LGELELIEYIRSLASRERPTWLEVGIGDDAAVIRLPGGDRVVVTTDMLIEGTHFERGTAPEAVGYKAVARALSDLAAMASSPLCTVAAVSFGASHSPDWARRLSKALLESAEKLGAPLVGGDTSSGTAVLSLTLTALGLPGPKGVVRRAGARPGDAVCVTGRLGGSLMGRHLTFKPRTQEALELAGRFDVHAMIDISDGLSTDALHIAQESGVGLTLRAEAIPISEDACVMAGRRGPEDSPIRHALNDGEDYELLFCLSQADAVAAAQSGLAGAPVSIIGIVTAEKQSFILCPDGSREPLRGGGWEHLKR
jgi:thiamine-monophosphate kinase